MNTTVISKRFLVCPKCNRETQIEHMFAAEPRMFGPWHCDGGCPVEMNGTCYPDGRVEVTIREEPQQRGWALLKFRDPYMIYEEEYGRIDHWDYFYHSHQCPTNLLGRIQAVYSADSNDPHGLLRYVAGIDASDEVDEKIKAGMGLRELFTLFRTDGQPRPSEWPEENGGVIPWIAEMQREYAKKGDA